MRAGCRHRPGRRHAARQRRPHDLGRRRRGAKRDRLDPLLRHERAPRPDRGRGEGLRCDASRLAEGGAEARAQRPARSRRRTRGDGRRGPERLRPETRRHRLRHGDRRRERDPRAGADPARARAGSRLAELPPERPRRLCERPAGDLARDQGPRTTPSSRPAPPAPTRSARPRRSSSAETRTRFWPAAARRACTR